MKIKTKECPQCGWGHLGKAKRFPKERQDPVFSEEEIRRLFPVAVKIFFNKETREALKNCPHCGALLEYPSEEK